MTPSGWLAASTRRLRSTTLRGKLVAVVLTLLTVGFVLIAGATSFALHGFLLDRLDQQLVAAGDRFSISLEHPSDADIDRDDRQFQRVAGQASGTLGARLFDGTVTAAAVVGGSAPKSQARAVLARLKPTTSPRAVRLPGLGTYRVIVARGDDGDLLVTGLPEESVDDTIRRLLGIEAVVFGVALVLVGVSGAAFVGLALRPLNRVADTAVRVADLPLSSGVVSLPERAPEADPRTEVGKVSEAFNHMLEHVESALRQRQASEDRLRRFVADASHELRTPVAVVRSHAEYAQRTADSLPDPVRQSLSRIAAESERMGHLVDDLLLLARLDSGRALATDPVDLTRLVLDAVSDARIAAQDHRWQLDLPADPVTVVGDAHALHQVLANLLANARTHTPAGTTVSTSLHWDEVAGTAELAVADDGPGIPSERLPKMFERFVRGDDSRSPTEGSSGLGLAIVKAIVDAHHGEVSATSGPGGTRFVIRLPAPPSPGEPDDPEYLDLPAAPAP